MPQQLAVGQFLVAAPSLHDPDFAHSVILLIRYDRQAAVGLFVNRPSDVPVSEVYPGLKSHPVKLYIGGPITIGVRALLRSRTPPSPSQRLFGDIYLINNRPLLKKFITDGTPTSSFRVYAGSCGWTAPQLQDELRRGLWRVVPATPASVFDSDPETLWVRLR
ncbi:MAG TPA: YqgE/AlgH family protein [Bryobacteraceae bacterium]|nr:YqgE/AlgH family protein [Bryobacteraceae bacterium]